MGGTRRGRNHRVVLSGVIVAFAAATSVGLRADFHAPPRYDGAGYAVLGLALSTGRGYREIHTPTSSPHTHFPPGYPLVLAALWTGAGRTVEAAHALSVACTVSATLAAWWWFRSMYAERVALAGGLALATNWAWCRDGWAVQSEPVYFLLGQLAVLAATRAGRGGGVGQGVALGALLGSCVLTRHVGAVLALAVGVDLVRRGRRASLSAAALSAFGVVLPWVVWLAVTRRPTQLDLVAGDHPAAVVVRQIVFYVRRLPDQWVGPVVEVGTVFTNSTPVFLLVNTWAVAATGLIAWGWWRALRRPSRRLAGLIPLTTFPLLWIWPFTEAGRFLVPLVPCLIVGAIEGLGAVANRVGLRRPRLGAAWAVVALTLPYSGYALVHGRAGSQRRADRTFDAACAWIARDGDRPGPVLTGHPAEVYWLSGRTAVSPQSDDVRDVARSIDRDGVLYLLIDQDRYARAPESPLARYVRENPERARLVWSGTAGRSSVTIYEVRPARGEAG